MRILMMLAMIMALTNTACTADNIERMRADNMESFTADKIDWQDEPILPKGAKSALILGDPSKAGVFIAWLKLTEIYDDIVPFGYSLSWQFSILKINGMFHNISIILQLH